MGAYSNYGEEHKIIYIDKQKMKLDDSSNWQFLERTDPPPASWEIGDVMVMNPRKIGAIQSEVAHSGTNKSKGNKTIEAAYMGGCVSEKKEVKLKSLKENETYPENMLGEWLRIRKIWEGDRISLEDESVWQLTNLTNKKGVHFWQNQLIRVLETGSRLRRNYNLELEKEGGPYLTGTFLGFQEQE